MSKFLHGIEVQELDLGPRPISTSSASVIGLVGTAEVDEKKGLKANSPVLIPGSRKKVDDYFPVLERENLETLKKELEDKKKELKEKKDALDQATQALENLGENATKKQNDDANKEVTNTKKAVAAAEKSVSEAEDELTDPVKTFSGDNTIRHSLNGILEQTGAMIVVVRAESSSQDHIVSAIEALKSAESIVHQTPRLLIAPGFSHEKAIRDKLAEVATIQRGIAIVDGLDESNHAEVIKDNKSYNDPRMYMVYPKVKVSCGDDIVRIEPASARVAGVIVRSDTNRGYWFSPSNQNINGICGTEYPIDFALDNPNSAANQLNEGRVTTIIHQNGYRLWGNRSTTADPKWAFINVRRTADIINDSLLRAHLWAIDRNITKTYVEDVSEGVNAFLRQLRKIGAIINGKCWADPEINSWDQVVQGKVTFDFDFTPPYPAEHITFRSMMVNDYLEEVFS